MTKEDACWTLLDLIDSATGWSDDAVQKFREALEILAEAANADVFVED